MVQGSLRTRRPIDYAAENIGSNTPAWLKSTSLSLSAGKKRPLGEASNLSNVLEEDEDDDFVQPRSKGAASNAAKPKAASTKGGKKLGDKAGGSAKKAAQSKAASPPESTPAASKPAPSRKRPHPEEEQPTPVDPSPKPAAKAKAARKQPKASQPTPAAKAAAKQAALSAPASQITQDGSSKSGGSSKRQKTGDGKPSPALEAAAAAALPASSGKADKKQAKAAAGAAAKAGSQSSSGKGDAGAGPSTSSKPTAAPPAAAKAPVAAAATPKPAAAAAKPRPAAEPSKAKTPSAPQQAAPAALGNSVVSVGDAASFLALQQQHSQLKEMYAALKDQKIGGLEAMLEEEGQRHAELQATTQTLAANWQAEAERQLALAKAAGAEETQAQLAALQQENLSLQGSLLGKEKQVLQLEAQLAELQATMQALLQEQQQQAAADAAAAAGAAPGTELPPALPSPGIACQFPTPAPPPVPSPGIACQFPTPAGMVAAPSSKAAPRPGGSGAMITPATALKRRASLGLSRFAVGAGPEGAGGGEEDEDGSPVEGLCQPTPGGPLGAAIAPATVAKAAAPKRTPQHLAVALAPEGVALNASDAYNAVSSVDLNPAARAGRLTPNTQAAVEAVKGITQMMRAAGQQVSTRRGSAAAAPSVAAAPAPAPVAAAAIAAAAAARPQGHGSPVVSNQSSNSMAAAAPATGRKQLAAAAAAPLPAAPAVAATPAMQAAALMQSLSPGVRQLLSGSTEASMLPLAGPATASAAAPAAAPSAAASTPGATLRTLPLQHLLDIQATPVAGKPQTFLYCHPPTGFKFELGPVQPGAEGETEEDENNCAMDEDGSSPAGPAGPEMAFCPVDLGHAAAVLPAFLREEIVFAAEQKGRFVFRLMEALNRVKA